MTQSITSAVNGIMSAQSRAYDAATTIQSPQTIQSTSKAIVDIAQAKLEIKANSKIIKSEQEREDHFLDLLI